LSLGGGVSVRTQDFFGLAVAIVTVAGCAYFYSVAVLDEHRALSRSAALAFFLFSGRVVVGGGPSVRGPPPRLVIAARNRPPSAPGFSCVEIPPR
jgi:hypothetical protein